MHHIACLRHPLSTVYSVCYVSLGLRLKSSRWCVAILMWIDGGHGTVKMAVDHALSMVEYQSVQRLLCGKFSKRPLSGTLTGAYFRPIPAGRTIFLTAATHLPSFPKAVVAWDEPNSVSERKVLERSGHRPLLGVGRSPARSGTSSYPDSGNQDGCLLHAGAILHFTLPALQAKPQYGV